MLSDNFLNTKFQLHSQFVLKILHALFSSSIGDKIAFKGGTLAYLCYHLERYSTDIDLDLLQYQDEEEVKSIITSLLANLGDIKNMTLGRDLHRWIFRYNTKGLNIKVELNKRDLTGNTYEYKEIQGQKIYCMDTETMVTNKLLALGERRYNRDLFDVHFFRKKGFDYKEEIIKRRKNLTLKEYLSYLLEELPHHYANNTILADGMGDVLTDEQKLRVKSHLLEETIQLLQEYFQHTFG